MANFNVLGDGYYLEGLAVGGNTVWYSDVTGGGIQRWDSDGSTSIYLADRRWIGGLLVLADGDVLSTGQGGIMRTDPVSGASRWQLRDIAGQAVNGINEMAPDGNGGFYFGTVDLEAIVAGKVPGTVAIYHHCAKGTVTLQCNGLGFTNGMALSADGTTFYCNESFDGTYAHDVAADGSLSNRRLFCRKPDCDGLAIDADGTLWITGFASSYIVRVAADGTELDPFGTLAEAITQLRFGGEDGRDLYLVSVPRDAGAGLAAGRLPVEKRSHLLQTRVDVPGQALPAVHIARGE